MGISLSCMMRCPRWLVLPAALLILTGCQSAQDKAYAIQQATAPQLKAHFSEPIDVVPKVMDYAEDGRHFFIASAFDQVRVYASNNAVPILSLPWPMSPLQPEGAGFIGSDTVYYAGRREVDGGETCSVNIRNLQAEQDLYHYEFEYCGWGDEFFANADYIAYGDKLINWHTGAEYQVRLAHSRVPGDYTLTASGKVLSTNHSSDEILLHDPLTDTSLWWDSGLSFFNSAITRSERYVIAQNYDGACRVWPVPALKPVRSCGRGGWFNKRSAHIALHPTDDSFAVSAGERVEVYRLVEGGHQRVFSRTLPKDVRSLALSSDHRVAIGDSNGRIEVWDTEQSILLGQVDLQLDGGGRLLTFAPSGKQVLYGHGTDFKVHVFDIPE